MRAALPLMVASLAAAAPGRWGEDPSKVPDFAPMEERRAPKIPDGDDWYKSLAGEQQVDALKDALLVCFNDVRKHTNWFWSTHNVGMAITLRNEPPIKLWAAWLHDSSYVSIPRIRLARGDRVAVRFEDRGMLGDKPLGSAQRRFDGKLPLVFDLRGIYVECRAMSHEKALQAAGERLRLIGAALDTFETQAPPDFHRREAGLLDPQHILYKLQHSYGKLSVRYVAGLLGWEDPVIQELLARIARVENHRKQELAAALEQTVTTLPSAGEWVAAGDRRMRVGRVVCGTAAHGFVERTGECAVLVDVAAAPPAQPIGCRGFRDANLIDSGGESVPLLWTEALFDGGDQPCRGQADVVRVPLPYAAGPHPKLLQVVLPGDAGVALLRVD